MMMMTSSADVLLSPYPFIDPSYRPLLHNLISKTCTFDTPAKPSDGQNSAAIGVEIFFLVLTLLAISLLSSLSEITLTHITWWIKRK
jgi:hypothetical protein